MGTHEPVLDFCDFEPMEGAMYDAYQGCEGEAEIAFVADPNELATWQFDLVVDEAGFQVHYSSMGGDQGTWGIDMYDRDVALAIGRRVGRELVEQQVPMDESRGLDEVTEVLARFGMSRL